MSYTLLRETERTARKEHRCIWCPEKILPGEKYVDERSVYDGNMQHHKWHPECLESCRDDIAKTGDDEIYPHESKRGSVEQA